MINTLLKDLGFNDKEAEVYLALLKAGKITPGSLAQVVGLKRTTVYSIAKELVKKGVVTEDLGSPTLYLIAKSPENLSSIIKKEEKELEQKKVTLQKAVEELKTISKTSVYPIPKITFIHEDEVENYLYKATPKWDESVMTYDQTSWGYQDETFVQNYEEWIDWYWKTGSNPKTKYKLLSNKIAEKIKKEKFDRRQVRFWDYGHHFKTTTWILGDYVVMIVTNKRPHYLVEIHDATLAHDQREVFKGIWKTNFE
jgi:sugar-specific transcriptional regulator TrmB